MQDSSSAAKRQRPAPTNGVAQSNGSRQTAPTAPTAPAAAATQQQPGASRETNTAAGSAASGYIAEECSSFLYGGPFNRFALALKSRLDNEIDWACARLVAATSGLPDVWSMEQNAPALLEAMVAVLERSRRELSASARAGRRAAGVPRVQAVVVGDTGPAAVVGRAAERAGLLTTALFNLAQVGDGPTLMAQDPRVVIEATAWLRLADEHAGVAGLMGIKAELLDVLDTVLPYVRAPALDSAPVQRWPVFGSRDSAELDPLAMVETCLWEELVRLVQTSEERKLVVGAVRVMVQSVSWHPQLAREILELPEPRWAAADQAAARRCVGELVNRRLAELLLAPDAELASACLELLVNMVRLEAMAETLDEELAAHVQREGAPKKRRRVLAAGEEGGSGAQTPVFGFGGMARSAAAAATAAGSERSMLPDGLAALVALVMQQWVAAAVPLAAPSSAPAAAVKPLSLSAAQIRAAASRQPTEPELREACTWVLLNYEHVAATGPTLQVEMAGLFANYQLAKQRQTVPRIGRALTLGEMVRVVTAVFPKATMATVPRPAGDGLVAVNLRPKTPHVVPIPALVLDAEQQRKILELNPEPAPRCGWLGCDAEFSSEAQAAEHVAGHVAGAEACRWRGCNRIPAEQPATADEGRAWVERWVGRHVLVHGPFFRSKRSAEQAGRQDEASDAYSVALRARELKALGLDDVAPSVVRRNGRHVVAEQRGVVAAPVVLQMAEQGMQVLEQLQRWADRRSGAQGEEDCGRVWRGAADVVERVAFVAALNSVVAPYAARLLAVIGKKHMQGAHVM
ncbi:hypothetical protein GGI15_001494 [Coemansia interrupta]|uniref:Uncharacterized protein n=1 Tax=Coemansia interrupta TaxID=1126814 RepID=A0A9W8LMW1_9FUNG|nr:hypothetical protein GGI15_001494 [Coemansia interrupta]